MKKVLSPVRLYLVNRLFFLEKCKSKIFAKFEIPASEIIYRKVKLLAYVMTERVMDDTDSILN